MALRGVPDDEERMPMKARSSITCCDSPQSKAAGKGICTFRQLAENSKPGGSRNGPFSERAVPRNGPTSRNGPFFGTRRFGKFNFMLEIFQLNGPDRRCASDKFVQRLPAFRSGKGDTVQLCSCSGRIIS